MLLRLLFRIMIVKSLMGNYLIFLESIFFPHASLLHVFVHVRMTYDKAKYLNSVFLISDVFICFSK